MKALLGLAMITGCVATISIALVSHGHPYIAAVVACLLLSGVRVSWN